MRRIAAILCSAAILASYPGIAALGQEPEIAIPVGAGVSGSSLYGQEEGWTGGDAQAAGSGQETGGAQAEGNVQAAGNAQAAEAPADQNQAAVQIAAPSAILMEASTGQVIYEKGADEKRSPASVTKVMTLILIFDALQSGKIQLTDEVVTSAHAKSMGGSQVFLEEGEKQTVETLIKCIVIASGNEDVYKRQALNTGPDQHRLCGCGSCQRMALHQRQAEHRYDTVLYPCLLYTSRCV